MKITQFKKPSSIGIIILLLSITSCEDYNPFSRTTTSIQASINNRSSNNMTAIAQTYQNYSANDCTSSGYARSAPVTLTPGQTTQVSSSITCNAKVRSHISVTHQSNYDLGYVAIHDQQIWNKLALGLQFQVSNSDRTRFLNLQIVQANPQVGGYDYYWKLAPQGSNQVAWLEKSKDSDSVGYLIFSLPSGLGATLDFIEFPESYGIDNFGNYQVIHENGVYRAHYGSTSGSTIYINGSELKDETVICDNVGCLL